MTTKKPRICEHEEQWIIAKNPSEMSIHANDKESKCYVFRHFYNIKTGEVRLFLESAVTLHGSKKIIKDFICAKCSKKK